MLIRRSSRHVCFSFVCDVIKQSYKLAARAGYLLFSALSA